MTEQSDLNQRLLKLWGNKSGASTWRLRNRSSSASGQALTSPVLKLFEDTEGQQVRGRSNTESIYPKNRGSTTDGGQVTSGLKQRSLDDVSNKAKVKGNSISSYITHLNNRNSFEVPENKSEARKDSSRKVFSKNSVSSYVKVLNSRESSLDVPDSESFDVGDEVDHSSVFIQCVEKRQYSIPNEELVLNAERIASLLEGSGRLGSSSTRSRNLSSGLPVKENAEEHVPFLKEASEKIEPLGVRSGKVDTTPTRDRSILFALQDMLGIDNQDEMSGNFGNEVVQSGSYSPKGVIAQNSMEIPNVEGYSTKQGPPLRKDSGSNEFKFHNVLRRGSDEHHSLDGHRSFSERTDLHIEKAVFVNGRKYGAESVEINDYEYERIPENMQRISRSDYQRARDHMDRFIQRILAKR